MMNQPALSITVHTALNVRIWYTLQVNAVPSGSIVPFVPIIVHGDFSQNLLLVVVGKCSGEERKTRKEEADGEDD